MEILQAEVKNNRMLLEVKKHLREAAEREKQLKTISHDSQVGGCLYLCVKCLGRQLHCMLEFLPIASSCSPFPRPFLLTPIQAVQVQFNPSHITQLSSINIEAYSNGKFRVGFFTYKCAGIYFSLVLYTLPNK